LAAATGALEVSIAKKLDSASFDSYTASNDTKWNTIGGVTSSLLSSQTNLNLYTSSQDTKNSTLGTYTGSIDTKFSTLGTYTGSVDTKFNTIGSYTASNDTKWNTLQNVTSSLINATGSYATTGSNTFIGTNIFSGSVQGVVTNISVLSSTASIDCGLGNFFNLALPSGSTYLTATNIRPGLTITVKVDTNSNRTVVVDSSKLKFQNGAPYINTGTATNDILTFVSFDTGSLYGVAANLFS
jgi:hypothetical protein